MNLIIFVTELPTLLLGGPYIMLSEPYECSIFWNIPINPHAQSPISWWYVGLPLQWWTKVTLSHNYQENLGKTNFILFVYLFLLFIYLFLLFFFYFFLEKLQIISLCIRNLEIFYFVYSLIYQLLNILWLVFRSAINNAFYPMSCLWKIENKCKQVKGALRGIGS